MKKKKDLQLLINSLLGKEVDTIILLETFSKYYNKSIEALSSAIKFKVIKCTNINGTIYKGIINFEDETLTVNLSCNYIGYRPTYTITSLC